MEDKYHLVWFICVLLGTGTLLPWNVFLTEKEFYDVRFQVRPYRTFVAENFMSLFALIFNTANLLSLAFLIKFQKYFTFKVLVLQPFLQTLALLVVTAYLALRVDVSGEMMARITMPSLALMGFCTACLQGGSLQLASQLSTTHIRGVVSGIAVGGVVTSSLSFLSQLRADGTEGGVPTPQELAPAAFTYFSASAAVIVLCILGYWALGYLPYSQNRLFQSQAEARASRRKLPQDEYEEPLLFGVNPDEANGSSSRGPVERPRAVLVSVELDYTVYTRDWQSRHAFTIYCTALCMCLGVTMATHPGVSAFICSVHNPAKVSPCAARVDSVGWWVGDLFLPVIFVLFSLGDFAGRMLSGYGPWARGAPKPLSILAYSFARIGIAAALLFCNVITPTQWVLPELMPSDVAPLALIALLGATQGHLISTICMHAPSTLPPNEQSKYGPVTSFAISLGCFIGSFVSLGLTYMFQTHTV